MKKIILLSFLLLSILNQYAQTITLNFTAKVAGTWNSLPLDSVHVQNQTVGCDTTVYGESPILVIPVHLGIDEPNLGSGPQLLSNVPNPFNNVTIVELNLPFKDHLRLLLTDNLGKHLTEYHGDLAAGNHKFEIHAGCPGLLLLNVLNNKSVKTIKLINTATLAGKSSISKLESMPENFKHSLKASSNGFEYHLGDGLVYTAMARGYENATLQDSPISDTNYRFFLAIAYDPPTVITSDVTGITLTTAKCGGTVITEGYASVIARGICWATTPSPLATGSHTTDGSGIGAFVSNMTGLTGGTLYYVRAYATNYAGTGYGNEMVFTTLPLPTVSTTAVTDITQSTATSGGTVTSDGGATVTAKGVCWSTSNNPSIANNHTIDGSGTGLFVSHLTGLSPNTPYYVRAYATNSVGTAYGNEISFIGGQPITPPTVTTTAVTIITPTTATSGGAVTSDGGAMVTARGVCWATTPNPLATGSHTTDGDGAGVFISNITGLAEGTLYYMRAYATNSVGTAYGVEASFTTLLACGASVTVNHVAGVVAPVNKTVTYGTITNIAGETAKCWTTQNLGSDHQATAVNDNSEASAGWYWQFNRKQGYKHDGITRTPNTTWIWIDENSNWLPANDPCSLELGSGWRLPTHTEWTNVHASGGWTNWNGPWNSGLKLHAAGYLDYSDGSLGHRGSFGGDWSSVQGGSADGWDLGFDSGGSGIYNDGKAYGFSVRCLRENISAATLPTLTTTIVSGVASSSATSGGAVTSDGGAMVTARGVCWATTPSPMATGSHTTDGGGIGVFTSNLTGLAGETLYYVRAYATNSAGTSYGNELTFTTSWGCGASVTVNHVAGVVAPVNKTVTYGTVTNIPGETAKCWITQNLGSDHQATAVDDATEASAGWYWQFNRKQGYKHDGSVLTPAWTITSINENSNWIAANDPCTLELGSGWRLPTLTEWDNVNWYWTDWNGPWNSGLKLHAAGYLYNSLYDRGSWGYFWSCSQYSPTSGGELYFDSGGISTSHNGVKVVAKSVRCLRENVSPATLPILTTSVVSGVTSTTATSGGTVTSDGGAVVTAKGVCWGKSSNSTLAKNYTVDGSGTGVFTSNMTGLPGGTQYFVRAYATNSVGTSYGNEWAFTTLALPTVSTTAVTDITQSAATSGGTVTSDGGSTVTACGVCWGTSNNPSIANNHTIDGSGTGLFVSHLTGLSPNTPYYVRAYATNSVGTAYGNETSFIGGQPITPPTVTTTAVTIITPTTASSGGNVTSDGGATVTARGVCWATTPSPLATGSHTTDRGGTGTFVSNMTGLTGGTLYYIRAYATNSLGTSYGNELTFTTLLACGASVTVNHVAGFVAPVNKTVTYGTITNIPGEPTKCWITQNLGSDHQAAAFDDATEASAGWYWQFNRKQGYKHDGTTRTPATTWIIGIGENSDWLPANDPCTLELGSGWRLPTETEWENVDATGDWNSWYGPWNSGLKLHAAGYLYNSPCERGSWGYYWSSVQYNTTNSWHLNFLSSNSRVSNENKTWGSSVRCLRENVSAATLPTITTTVVSAVTSSSAKSGGIVTSDGGVTVTTRGVCWDTSPNPLATGSHASWGGGIGAFAAYLTGLTGGTLYYVRAYATNSVGTAYGDELTFTTLTLPTVSTTAVTDITQSTATSGGTVISDGGATVTARGVCWGTSNNPTLANNYTVDGSGTGWFVSHLTGLAPNTSYYVRAYATNSVGTAYGNVTSFTGGQPITPPTVTTTAVTNITQTTASSGGDVTSDGGTTVTARGVCWATTPSPLATGSHTSDGGGMGVFTSNLTGLAEGTLYYMRAYATNNLGTSYGNELTFTTLWACGASVTVNHVAGVVAPVNKTVTYGTVTNIPGEPTKCWITQNLGSDHQATAVADATEASAGWYWQFNLKQGYKHDGTTLSPNSTWNILINENSNWLPTNDPCNLELGSGWRLPTHTEWTNVHASGGWPDWNGPWNSGLKLHAAGYLYNPDGSLNHRGSYGDYWSSVQYSTPFGWLFGFSSGSCNMVINYKTYGMSVRCLQENGSAATLPIITTTVASGATSTTATSGGTITSDGGAAVTARGVCWGTSSNPTLANNYTVDGSGTGWFVSYLTGLVPNTLYYVRAYATNSIGTAYGNEASFTTLLACGTSVTVNHVAGVVAPVNKTVTYGTVTNVPGETAKCWLTQNLGSDHQATAANDNTDASAGWYWQFNHKQGYKHDGTVLTPFWAITSLNENSNWIAANDPCTLELGSGWRLPIKTEWDNVNASGGWTNWNGPWNSGLKLHAAGYLYNWDGSLNHRGSYGNYWSSVQYSTAFGWFFGFSSGSSNMVINNKAGGFSVRCLRDN